MILYFFICPFASFLLKIQRNSNIIRAMSLWKIWQKVRDFDEQTSYSILKICKDIQRIINFTYSTKWDTISFVRFYKLFYELLLGKIIVAIIYKYWTESSRHFIIYGITIEQRWFVRMHIFYVWNVKKLRETDIRAIQKC